MLPQLLVLGALAGVIWMVVRSPAGLRLPAAALLLILPVLSGTVAWMVAKRDPTTTLDRDTYAFVGLLGGWVLGALGFYLLRQRHRATA